MLTNLLREFYSWNPGLVQMMKECSHHYSPEHLCPYHLENDCLTHTLMAYNELIHLNILDDTFNLLCGISVLCHDIGKVYTRHSPKSGKIAMYNHTFASIQDTIEFINYLDEKNWFDNISLSVNHTMYYVLTPISNHMDFMDLNKNDRFGPIINNDPNLNYISNILLHCDLYGSISEDNKEDVEIQHRTFDSYPLLNNVLDDDIVLFCGPPGSGKDYFAYKQNRIILSYDDIRVEVFKNAKFDLVKDYNSLSYNELYHRAFEYCKNKNSDLNNYLKKNIEIEMGKRNKVGICNTNLTRKLRGSLIKIIRQNNEYLKNCTIGVIYLCCKKQNLYFRDNNRYKTVGKEVINKFLYNQQIPTMKEDIDNIIFVNN